MNIHQIFDIPIFILLVAITLFIFMLQILFLNHILYDTYTTFVIGVQFQGKKIKNFINVYHTPQRKCIKFSDDLWIKINPTIFKYTRICRSTILIQHQLSGVKFRVTTGKKTKKKCIKLHSNYITISKDLLYIIDTNGYYIVSNRFCE